MRLDIFDRTFNFILKKGEKVLLLVDTAEDEINQGNEIKALVRVLIVILLIVIMAAAGISSIVLLFSKYGLFMKIISLILAIFFLSPVVILIIYVFRRFLSKNAKKI
ncbi:hypothetical protein ACFL0E_00950, partial [Nanoarchaeota archaeon]